MQIAMQSRLPAMEPATSPREALPFSVLPRDVLAAGAVFIVLAMIFYGSALKGAASHIYWQDWSDQEKYVSSARAFAAFVLDPRQHWYPLLYPMAIATFLWLPLFYAALIVNGLCYTLAYIGFREVAARFDLPPTRALLLFVATTLLGPTLSRAWIEPWTTTLSSALIWLVLGRLCRDACKDQAPPPPRASQAALSGVLLGLIPLCRPADLIVSVFVGGCFLIRSLRSPGGLRSALALVGGGLVVAAPYLVVYLAIYGPHPTDYMRQSAAFGFDFATLGWKAQILLIEPRPFYPYGVGLLERFPWAALGLAGLLAALIRPERRRIALLIGAPAIAYAIVIIAYVDLLPSGLWAFRNFHYFKWLMPLIGLFGYDFVHSFLRAKLTSLLALLAVLATSSLQFEAVAAGPDEAARALVFASPDAEFGRLYFERAVIADRAGLQRNMYEYHQVPDAHGLVYAEALKRDFVGDERWTDPPGGVDWPSEVSKPRADAPLHGGNGQEPLARFRPKLTMGWPCWLPPYRCRASLMDEANTSVP